MQLLYWFEEKKKEEKILWKIMNELKLKLVQIYIHYIPQFSCPILSFSQTKHILDLEMISPHDFDMFFFY
jgi:hypothetical protein